MRTIQERERNLFNAIDTLAQFYDEIESFFNILQARMEREGYSAGAERLQPGTFTLNNLSRRLIGTITVIFIKGAGDELDDVALVEDETAEDDESKVSGGKAEVSITQDMCIPLVFLSLYTSRNIPAASKLTSPLLYTGAIGKPQFIDRKTENVVVPDKPVLSLSSLVNMRLKAAKKAGDKVRIPCWKPSRMRKYELETTLLDFKGQPLLGIDSIEKVDKLADDLAKLPLQVQRGAP